MRPAAGPEQVLARLRRFLLALAGALFIGTVAELAAAGHTASPAQWIPFGLCGLGLLGVLAAWAWPRRAVLLGLRAGMGLVGLGSLLGLYEHVAGNLAFQLEIQPNAAVGDVIGKLWAARTRCWRRASWRWPRCWSSPPRTRTRPCKNNGLRQKRTAGTGFSSRRSA